MTTIANGHVSKNVQYESLSEGHDVGLPSPESSASSHRPVLYRVYSWRWFMLATLCFLNVSNGMVSGWAGEWVSWLDAVLMAGQSVFPEGS
jgi:hypothetical protein